MSFISGSGGNVAVAPPGPIPVSGQFSPSPIKATFTLINGTPVIATFSTPNDGVPHTLIGSVLKAITALETGGQIRLHYLQAGVAQIQALFNGGQAAGQFSNFVNTSVDPNTVITISQDTALSAGGPSIFTGCFFCF